jgi:hypothetical protein
VYEPPVNVAVVAEKVSTLYEIVAPAVPVITILVASPTQGGVADVMAATGYAATLIVTV